MLGVTDFAGVTQTGNVRRHNEDSYLIRNPLFMVADGVGGAAAGELASRIATEEFASLDLERFSGEAALREAIARANRLITQRAADDPSVAGMGTTVVAALVGGDGRVAFAYVGDSRAYLLRGGTLQRLSEDHTLVGELVRKGELSEADAERHPQRNVITRSLGADADVEADTFGLDAQEGDVVLLCSDGLNTMIDEAEIGRLMAEGTDAAGRARNLVRAALAAGGEDNVTAVVFVIGQAADDDEQTSGEHILPDRIDIDDDAPAGRSRARTAARLSVATVIAVGLAVAAITGLRWSHFVGADQRTGRVAIYQGLPIDLPFGVHLYHETELTPVSFATLSASQRKALFDHSLHSLADARATVQPIEAASP